jgi:flagellar biosynthesis/type III secretory pathway M-ring protein FliF/YscJ
LDTTRGDSLKVVDVKFQQPTETIPEEEMAGGLDFVAIARQASLGIMAVCALIVLRMFKGARKKAQLEAVQGQLSGTEGSAGLIAAESSNSQSLMFRRQIAGALRNNPERVRQLFTNWIEEKGD